MKRRHFLTVVGGAALMPIAGRAQQAMPVIGYLGTGAATGSVGLTPFRQGLKEAGYVENQNVKIDYRWAEGEYDRLPSLAADLVRRRVNLIAASPSPAALAAKAATSAIPIIFSIGGDPVGAGLVASLNHPGGNLTGVTFFTGILTAKRLELLNELLPRRGMIAALANPKNDMMTTTELLPAAKSLGIDLRIFAASTDDEIDAAFAALVHAGARAFILGNDPFLGSRRAKIAALALHHGLPSMFPYSQYAVVGGLMSYGTDVGDVYRQQGLYAGRVLKDEKPGDLPVLQPTKFELVVNLKTAKALGLTIPEAFLLRAEEVIE